MIFPFILVFLISACKEPVGTSDNPVITVSIEPLKFFTSVIAGDKYDINVIVPAGASPATYEPPPSVIKGISNSDLLIINGYLGFEQAWIQRILNIDADIELLKLSDSQELISADSHRHGDIIHYTGVDPHFWLSPKRASLIAKDIRDFIIEQDTENKDYYLRNYNILDSIIQEADRYISSSVKGKENLSFLIFHPSLTYFAEDYGFEQIPVEVEGKEPSPSELRELIDRGRMDSIKVIFVQREFDTKNANLIGKEIGAKTIIIDPLSSDWFQSVMFITDNI